jgi:uncharacterized alpha-E superfamily protein
MISRVAESCYWLLRYMERAENTARLLQVNRTFILDVALPELARWQPVIVVTGEQQRFAARFPDGLNDAEAVQHYLTWDEQNPVSISTSVHWARENARTIRDAITEEMWQALNDFWRWLGKGAGKRLYTHDRDAFYQKVKDAAALFHGVFHNTMLHDEPFEFMRLGMLLERASQTARIVDVKYHMLGGTRDDRVETPVETAQWLALLRSCSATDSYFRHTRGTLSGPDIAGFLLYEELFPRSVRHCLGRALGFLRSIDQRAGRNEQGRALLILEALVESLRGADVREVVARGLHGELTRIIDRTLDVCIAVHAGFFDPSVARRRDASGPAAAAAVVAAGGGAR